MNELLLSAFGAFIWFVGARMTTPPSPTLASSFLQASHAKVRVCVEYKCQKRCLAHMSSLFQGSSTKPLLGETTRPSPS